MTGAESHLHAVVEDQAVVLASLHTRTPHVCPVRLTTSGLRDVHLYC